VIIVVAKIILQHSFAIRRILLVQVESRLTLLRPVGRSSASKTRIVSISGEQRHPMLHGSRTQTFSCTSKYILISLQGSEPPSARPEYSMHASATACESRDLFPNTDSTSIFIMEGFHIVSPLLESDILARTTGSPVYLKMDNMQPAGTINRYPR
jgi:hypothetical protein